jgi:hypothetical protein
MGRAPALRGPRFLNMVQAQAMPGKKPRESDEHGLASDARGRIEIR